MAASLETPQTPNPSMVDLDYHRIKTPKLTGKFHNKQWSHAQSYGEDDVAIADWLTEKERTTVIRSVPKLKIHEEDFLQSPRSVTYSQNLTQYERMVNEINRPHPQFRLVYPRHMLSSIRKVTGLSNFIVQPNAVAPTPEERFNITRELIVKSAAPKLDSGYPAHISHRPEFDNRHFDQTIEGSNVPQPDIRDSKRAQDIARSQTVPTDMLLQEFEELKLEDLQNDILFSKEYVDALDSPVRRSLMRLKDRKVKEKYAYQDQNVQRVRTREYLNKQLTRTNYISSSLGLLMSTGDQTTFERDLTWKTARKIEILRNKSRSTPLVPYGILYPRIGGITRFQGRPTKGEISLIEKRVNNMSKSATENRSHLKAWKDVDKNQDQVENVPETSGASNDLNYLSNDERRQIALDEAKISRMQHSFQKLPNIDKKTAEMLARTITEDEKKEQEMSAWDNMGLVADPKVEPRRGKAPTGVLYKSNLVPRNKPKEPGVSASDQFGLGKVPHKDPAAFRKVQRKPVRMKPAFPAKEKPSLDFDPNAPPATPSLSKRNTEEDMSNKVFITQPREPTLVDNKDSNTDSDDKKRSLSSGERKSVSFEEKVEEKVIDDTDLDKDSQMTSQDADVQTSSRPEEPVEVAPGLQEDEKKPDEEILEPGGNDPDPDTRLDEKKIQAGDGIQTGLETIQETNREH